MKFYDKVGFVREYEESAPGVIVEDIVEHYCFGDVEQLSRRLTNPGQINDSFDITNVISIVADPFIRENFAYMRYVHYMGTNWKISNVSVDLPRLKLTLGGLWNGNTGSTT